MVKQIDYLLVLALRAVIFVKNKLPDECVRNMQTLRKIGNKVFNCLLLSGLVAGVLPDKGDINSFVELLLVDRHEHCIRFM